MSIFLIVSVSYFLERVPVCRGIHRLNSIQEERNLGDEKK